MTRLDTFEPWEGTLWPATGPPPTPIPLLHPAMSAPPDPFPLFHLDPDPVDVDRVTQPPTQPPTQPGAPMNTTRWSLLKRVALSQGDSMTLTSAFDLNCVSTLDIVVTVHTAGTGTAPRLLLMHAIDASDEASWLEFETPINIDLTTETATWARVDAFTGYLAWFLDGTIEGSPTVSVDLIARS